MINPTFEQLTDSTFVAEWNLAPGDECSAIQWGQYADRSVQIVGDTVVRLFGSNDEVTWFPLHDLFGNVINTSSGLFQVAEVCLFVKPVAQSPGTSKIVMFCKE